MQWIFCILSCALLGLGVMIEIKAKLLVVPGDGLVIAMAALTVCVRKWCGREH